MTDPTFKLGEIAIAVNDPFLTPLQEHNRYNGEECTIVAPLENRCILDGNEARFMPCYGVEFKDGARLLAAPHELKKIPPKKTDMDAWAKAKIADLITIKPEIFQQEEEPATV